MADFLTLAGAQYSELKGSGRSEGDATTRRAWRLFRVKPYGFSDDFVNALMPRRILNPLTGEITTRAGAAFAPGSRLYATNYVIEPMGKSSVNSITGGAEYEEAKVTIEYATLPYEQNEEDSQGGVFLTINRTHSGQFLTEPGEGWVWPDGTALNQTGSIPRRVEAQSEIVITRHQVPSLPNHLGYIGKVNSTALLGAAAGTVMFLGSDDSTELSWDSEFGLSVVATLNIRFVYKPSGWQKLFNPKAGGYQTVTTKVGGNKLYETAEFRDLIPEYTGA